MLSRSKALKSGLPEMKREMGTRRNLATDGRGVDGRETAREQRASRGATAGWVGKALKVEKPMGGCSVK
jgi:hypothetical protein